MFSSGFGKKPKHRQFGYIPRYYDEEKERLQEQVGKYSGDNNDNEKLKSRISSGLRQRYAGDDDYRRSNSRKSTIRVFYILMILVVITVLIMRSDKFLRILEKIAG